MRAVCKILCDSDLTLVKQGARKTENRFREALEIQLEKQRSP